MAGARRATGASPTRHVPGPSTFVSGAPAEAHRAIAAQARTEAAECAQEADGADDVDLAVPWLMRSLLHHAVAAHAADIAEIHDRIAVHAAHVLDVSSGRNGQ